MNRGVLCLCGLLRCVLKQSSLGLHPYLNQIIMNCNNLLTYNITRLTAIKCMHNFPNHLTLLTLLGIVSGNWNWHCNTLRHAVNMTMTFSTDNGILTENLVSVVSPHLEIPVSLDYNLSTYGRFLIRITLSLLNNMFITLCTDAMS